MGKLKNVRYIHPHNIYTGHTTSVADDKQKMAHTHAPNPPASIKQSTAVAFAAHGKPLCRA